MKKHEDCLIENHEEKSWRKVIIKKHEDHLIESHEEKC